MRARVLIHLFYVAGGGGGGEGEGGGGKGGGKSYKNNKKNHFKCRCRSASYVGQTIRHLNTRVSEHLGISALTRNKSSNPKLTSILQHLNNTGNTASLDYFKIISSRPSSDELMIHLMIPNLNLP
jgi:hypothetical protein